MEEKRMNPYDEDAALAPSRLDAAAVETWLEDRARNGQTLLRFRGRWAYFIQESPCEVRIRLTPMPKREKKPAPEYLALCEESGWQYVGVYQVFHVWRCGDPAAPEMEMDTVVQAEGYRYVARRLTGSALGWTLGVSLLLLVLAAMQGWGNRGALLTYAQSSYPGMWPGLAVLCAIGILEAVLDLRRVRALVGRLRAGVPLDRPAPYRRKLWRTRVVSGLILAGYCFMVFVGPFLDEGRSILRDEETMARARYADGAALDPDREAEVCSARTKVLELVPRYYEIEQSTPVAPGEYRVILQSEYYRLLTEGLAEKLAEELAADTGRFWDVSLEPQTAPALDELRWCRDDRDWQFAVARLGKGVLFLRYEGGADLRDQGAYLAEVLAE